MTQTVTPSRPPRRQKRRSGSNSTTPTLEDLRLRAKKLVESSFDYIPNDVFEDPSLAKEILAEEKPVEMRPNGALPKDLPAHLARLCEAPLLTATEEQHLFRRMNYLKFRAQRLQTVLDLDQPDRHEVEACEKFAAEAKAIRDRIVSSNMRLVISVIKKFVTPQYSFDELLSEGISTLINTVDKFDFDRGFRFSTYAYRSIARSAYRSIADRQKEQSRFSNSDAAVLEIEDEGTTSSLDEPTWRALRESLGQIMDKLDRRERFIIRGRFALGAHRRVRTFQCLANKLGVSKERVRQLEQRAVMKLRNMAAEVRLDEFADGSATV